MLQTGFGFQFGIEVARHGGGGHTLLAVLRDGVETLDDALFDGFPFGGQGRVMFHRGQRN